MCGDIDRGQDPPMRALLPQTIRLYQTPFDYYTLYLHVFDIVNVFSNIFDYVEHFAKVCEFYR